VCLRLLAVAFLTVKWYHPRVLETYVVPDWHGDRVEIRQDVSGWSYSHALATSFWAMERPYVRTDRSLGHPMPRNWMM
jgi:hypothetical protein